MVLLLFAVAVFQPTLPARGATAFSDSAATLIPYFNPRSPHGERLALCCVLRHNESISTHAPRTGSDLGR